MAESGTSLIFVSSNDAPPDDHHVLYKNRRITLCFCSVKKCGIQRELLIEFLPNPLRNRSNQACLSLEFFEFHFQIVSDI